MSSITRFGLLCIFLATKAFSQGIPSDGTDFYLGYLHPSYNTVAAIGTAAHYKPYIIVTAYQQTTVSVSYFDPISKVEQFPSSYPVQARRYVQIPLDQTSMRMQEPGDISGEMRSCHITATAPISVQCVMLGGNSGGAYLALPVSCWGKKYSIASYNDNGVGAGAVVSGNTQLDRAAGAFIIVAGYNGTDVTITPTARTGGGHAGVSQGTGATGTPQPYTISLNRGQCWLVKSKSASQDGVDDISNSIVTATKPVAVIAGHEDAMTGDGSVGGRTLEGRDFMVEQLIPFEYWDNTGYISVPMLDSPSNDGEGVGEDLRMNVADMAVPKKVIATTDSDNELPTGTFQIPPAELHNRISPVHLHSDSLTKFSVMQYDLRNHGTTLPFPAPSMMTIVPRSCWKQSYLWYVPQNSSEQARSCYVTIMGLKDGVKYNGVARNWFSDSIHVVVSGLGQGEGNISKIGSQKKAWFTIPGHPDLRQVTYQISPGVIYHVSAPFPFMVYMYCSRGIDYDGDLGDFDADDFYYSYAMPAGMSLRTRAKMRIGLTVDSTCTDWTICATDSSAEGGIASVVMLDDPGGDIIHGTAYKHSNVSFSSGDDPQGVGEIRLLDMPKSFCFKVHVDNPGAVASAPLLIYDRNGNYRFIELRQSPKTIVIVPDPSADTMFANVKVGATGCRSFAIRNEGAQALPLALDSLKLSSSSFKLESVFPTLPAAIRPGDSLTFTICFSPTDSLLHGDTLRLSGSCLGLQFPVAATAVRPILVASDLSFGKVYVGKTVFRSATLKNVGQASLMVQSGTIVQSGSVFALDAASQSKLPISLAPGQSSLITISYTPNAIQKHDAWISWQTDVNAPFAAEHKPITNLNGEGFEDAGGVTPLASETELRIHPNPAKDVLTLTCNNMKRTDLLIEIYDLIGRLQIRKEVIASGIETEQFELPLSLSNGRYLVRCKTNTGVFELPLEVRK